jgi:hypothetical protein
MEVWRRTQDPVKKWRGRGTLSGDGGGADFRVEI